jgi:hypothetical protein
MTPRCSLIALAASVGLTLFAATAAYPHAERVDPSPVRPGPVPDIGRVNPTTLVVCKPTSKPTRAQHKEIHNRLRTETGPSLAQAQTDEAAWHRNNKLFKRCSYEHIQEAVNAAPDNTDILVMPGLYREEPSRAFPETACGDLPNCAYSFAYHVANPHDANLIAILGKFNITLEGTGAKPEDVLIDVGFAKDVGIRCDECTGFIVRNLWARDANEHGIYVLYSDGYIFDRTRGSYSRDYQLFSFASDNGLYTDCDAEGGGDSGLYVGASPATNAQGRFSAEIRRCKVHHNALGFSGTQGNSVWMHDNDFYDNALGISFNTQNNHQDPPQRFSLIENNLIHDNNFDIYATGSDVPPVGLAYDFFRFPVGTGLWIIGGDNNVIRNNRVYNNIRFGMILAQNPTEAPVPANVNRNEHYGNIIGRDPDGNPAPNLTAFPPGGAYAPGGSDFWWDESGNDNCWGAQDASSPSVKMDPPMMPGPCPAMNLGLPAATFTKLSLLASCLIDPNDPPNTLDAVYPCPWSHSQVSDYRNKNQRECGNGVLDLGEDCDSGSYGGGSSTTFIPSETCSSLGLGPGTLACAQDLCTWDTSGCAAPACTEYGASKVQARKLGTPPGDDTLDFRASFLASAAFNPATEETSFTFRDNDGLVHGATIPAGNPNWSLENSIHTYRDPSGTFGRVTRIDIGPSNQGIRAKVQVRGANLASASGAVTGTSVVRVGNDCWSDTTPCSSRGSNLLCRGRAQP